MAANVEAAAPHADAQTRSQFVLQQEGDAAPVEAHKEAPSIDSRVDLLLNQISPGEESVKYRLAIKNFVEGLISRCFQPTGHEVKFVKVIGWSWGRVIKLMLGKIFRTAISQSLPCKHQLWEAAMPVSASYSASILH
jgi:hypothetical protein